MQEGAEVLQCPEHGRYLAGGKALGEDARLCPGCKERGWGTVPVTHRGGGSGFSRRDRWWTKPEWLAYAVMKVWVAAWVTFIGVWLLVHGGHP